MRGLRLPEGEDDYWHQSSIENGNAWGLHQFSLPLQTWCLGVGKFYFQRAVGLRISSATEENE